MVGRTEKIISKGRELNYSSRQIADEVEVKLVDKLVQCFISEQISFNGLDDVLSFRSFLEKSLEDGCTEG